MDATVLLVFALGYLGMIAGGAPGLALATLAVAVAWLRAVAAWRGTA